MHRFIVIILVVILLESQVSGMDATKRKNSKESPCSSKESGSEECKEEQGKRTLELDGATYKRDRACNRKNSQAHRNERGHNEPVLVTFEAGKKCICTTKKLKRCVPQDGASSTTTAATSTSLSSPPDTTTSPALSSTSTTSSSSTSITTVVPSTTTTSIADPALM